VSSQKNIVLLVTAFFSFNGLKAQGSFDSLKIKQPKHYFATVFDLDLYRKPNQNIPDTVKQISKKLGTYGIKQTTFSFYTPLATKNWTEGDVIKNTHLLLTGNYMNLQPQFEGLRQHVLIKAGLGIRFIYNTGKKGLWFAEVSPFITRDAAFRSRPYFRLASTFIYSRNVSTAFNWRLGITKSFLWGNRFYLPFVGLRIGRLDKLNLSIQFPRSISLSMPLGHKFILSAYTRPQGGMWNFSNVDTLYFRPAVKTFHFTRYELNSGLRGDLRIGGHFALYLALGLSSKNNITFYSDNANAKRKNKTYDTYFYSKNLPSTVFLNIGLVLRLGKTRSFYNVKNIYDAIDINNVANGNNGNIQIPLTPRQASKLNLQSVQDLVDFNDF
jgi:hypothetical protein